MLGLEAKALRSCRWVAMLLTCQDERQSDRPHNLERCRVAIGKGAPILRELTDAGLK